MKNQQATLLVILMFAVILSGCTQTQDTSQLDNQIQALETENIKLQETLNEQKDSTIDFFKEYSIALINIHIATESINIAERNLILGNDYVYSEEYYYEFATNYFDTGQEQIEQGKSMLSRAKRKLQKIQTSAPNQFFKIEIENRIKYIDILLEIGTDLSLLLKYSKNGTYEVNYGTQEKSDEIMQNYNELIPQYNSGLIQLGKISTQIEIEWDQEWYPDYQQ